MHEDYSAHAFDMAGFDSCFHYAAEAFDACLTMVCDLCSLVSSMPKLHLSLVRVILWIVLFWNDGSNATLGICLFEDAASSKYGLYLLPNIMAFENKKITEKRSTAIEKKFVSNDS